METNFVMARFDRDPSVTFQVFFYDESVNTTPISFRGKQGVQIRLNSPYSVQRAKQQGWADITEEIKVVENSKKLEIPENVIVADAPKKKINKRKTRSRK